VHLTPIDATGIPSLRRARRASWNRGVRLHLTILSIRPVFTPPLITIRAMSEINIHPPRSTFKPSRNALNLKMFVIALEIRLNNGSRGSRSTVSPRAWDGMA
jgi:hypothetical protein